MRRISAIYVPVAQVRVSAWNAQRQSDVEFNALVDSVRETDGLIEAILIRPVGSGFSHEDAVNVSAEANASFRRYTGQATFECVHGEHRFRAASALGFTEVPCIIVEDLDDDMARILSVRLNQLHGQLDPVRLAALIKGLKGRHRTEALAQKLGFVKSAQLQKLLARASSGLPANVRNRLRAAAKEVESIEALSDVIHKIFNQYGSSLDFSFIRGTLAWQRRRRCSED